MDEHNVKLSKMEMQLIMLAMQQAMVGLDQKFGSAVVQDSAAGEKDSSHKE